MRISEEDVYSRRTEGDQSPPSQRTQAVNCLNFFFPKSFRILKRKHFKEIGSSRNRFSGNLLVIDYRPSKEAKLGITVVRQFGTAAERNLFKRRVREAFRLHRHLLEPLEMVVMPQRGIKIFPLELIIKDLLELTHVSQSRAAKSR